MPEGPIDKAIMIGLLDLGVVAAIKAPEEPAIPAMPATPEGMEAEFFLAIYRYAKNWLLQRGGVVAGAAPCAFVHLRSVNEDIERLAASEIGWFKDRHDYDVCGDVYVASCDFSVVARTSQPKQADVDALWTSMSGDGLTDMTHAVFRADLGEIILRRSLLYGQGSSIKVAVRLDQPASLSLDDMDRMLWRFHSTHTQLPGCNSMPWLNPRQRVPVPELERKISTNLCFFLNMALGEDYASTEHYVDGGRLDVRVAKEAMAPGHGHCALELKVLRSRYPSSSNGKSYTTVAESEMVKHATEGVDQAADYRTRIRAGSAYLCCFDARSKDEDQPAVQAWADTRSVRLRRYFMYGSPTSYREAKGEALKAGALLSGEVY